jgi:C1A family cysteine protease
MKKRNILVRTNYFGLFLLFFLFNSLFLYAQTDINALNEKIQKKGAKWRAKENPISRLSAEERRLRLGLKLPEFQEDYKIKKVKILADYPSSFDWRDNNGNWVTAVKDQGDCGSCWDFAAVGAFESLIRIATDDANLNIDLSEQFVLSCSDGGCDGWYTFAACQFLIDTGTPDEACMFYQEDDTIPCSDACADWSDRASQLSGWAWVTNDIADVDTIKASLLENPLPTSMAVYTDFFSYSDGVYEYVEGILEGYHAVVIVGWDDNPSDGGGGCWIVKNSWDTTWGEQGFFRIRWGEVEIGTWTIDQDMAGAEPAIAVNPGSLSSTLVQGYHEVQTIQITNNGTADLHYNIDINCDSYGLDKTYNKYSNISSSKKSHIFGTRAVSESGMKENHLKTSPGNSIKLAKNPPLSKVALFLREGFEGGIMPPDGWTKIDGPSSPGDEAAHWRIDSFAPYAGDYSAVCPWGYNLDEWLISPSLDFTVGSAPALTFYWASSYFWNVDPNDHGDLFVKVSTDGGDTWEQLWTFGDIGPWEDWTWYQTILDLSDYAGQPDVLIAFHVLANDNGDILIDEISLSMDTWIDADPSAGVILADSAVDVSIYFDTVIDTVVFDTGEYSATLQITSDDPGDALIQLPVTMDVINLNVNIPDVTAGIGDTILIPVEITDDVTGLDIYSAGMTISIGDTGVAKFLGANNVSTIANEWDMNFSISNGQITINMTSDSSLDGSGPLVNLEVYTSGNVGDSTSIVFENFIFNEGIPGVNTDNDIFIYLECNSEVNVCINDTSATEGSTIQIPVKIDDTSGMDILGVELSITYNSSIIEAVEAGLSGTIGEGWSLEYNILTGRINVAMSSSGSPLTGSGNLIFIQFNTTGSGGDTTSLHFDLIRFNEGCPVATGDDGLCTIQFTNIVDRINSIPTKFELLQNFPNPFNPMTTIHYALPKTVHVNLVVYDILGNKVKTLVNTKQTAGFKSLIWDGKDNSGHSVSSGLYIYKIHTPDFIKMRKMILLK